MTPLVGLTARGYNRTLCASMPRHAYVSTRTDATAVGVSACGVGIAILLILPL